MAQHRQAAMPQLPLFRGETGVLHRLGSWLRPHSIRTLVLAGFALVAAPLTASIIAAAYSVTLLAHQSEQAVYRSVDTTQHSRILMEQLVRMERSARQYQVVGDTSLFDVYLASHDQFAETGAALLALPLTPELASRVRNLANDESMLFGQLHEQHAAGTLSADTLEPFARLNESAHRLWLESTRLVAGEVDRLDQGAKALRRSLLWQIIFLVPATILVGTLFTLIIARPIRQLDAAIRRLGDGEFAAPLAVEGPRDLEYLGERLDWLRCRLLELEQQKRKFLRNVSHDLKTPLTNIREGSALLADQVVGELNSEQRDIAGILQSSADELRDQIESLLRHSRIEGQYVALNPGWVELRDLTLAVIKKHKIAMRAKRIKLDSRLEKVRIWGDESRLENVLDNLFSNAVKYSPTKSRLHVALSSGDRCARFELTDQGPGVAGEERDRIFDVFYRGHATRGGEVPGSGLGLTIAQEYVEAHRGNISVDASPHGHDGARFLVTLPLDLREVVT